LGKKRLMQILGGENLIPVIVSNVSFKQVYGINTDLYSFSKEVF